MISDGYIPLYEKVTIQRQMKNTSVKDGRDWVPLQAYKCRPSGKQNKKNKKVEGGVAVVEAGTGDLCNP
jgi:hypothetical protein